MLTGTELVEAIRAERTEPPSGIRTLGLDRTHHWLESVADGHAVLTWTVDDRYLNLEGAVICSWTVALADQALFFASSSACAPGESTRMRSLAADFADTITGGVVTIDAVIADRVGDEMHGTCRFLVDDRVVATVTATIQVLRL